jgi:alpha-ribazole phosphatase
MVGRGSVARCNAFRCFERMALLEQDWRSDWRLLRCDEPINRDSCLLLRGVSRMSEILFIRHAETDMAGTFCGHSDPELNARGHLQVAELVRCLRKENFGTVYSSDLRRAYATGRTIADAFHVNCLVRSALREIAFGQWEGLNWKEIEQQYEAYAHRWIVEYPRLSPPGGENFRDFERRVLDEVKLLSIEAENNDRGIVVVTHAGVIRVVLCALQGCSEDQAREQTRSYCSIVRHTISASSFTLTAEVEP